MQNATTWTWLSAAKVQHALVRRQLANKARENLSQISIKRIVEDGTEDNLISIRKDIRTLDYWTLFIQQSSQIESVISTLLKPHLFFWSDYT